MNVEKYIGISKIEKYVNQLQYSSKFVRYFDMYGNESLVYQKGYAKLEWNVDLQKYELISSKLL